MIEADLYCPRYMILRKICNKASCHGVRDEVGLNVFKIESCFPRSSLAPKSMLPLFSFYASLLISCLIHVVFCIPFLQSPVYILPFPEKSNYISKTIFTYIYIFDWLFYDSLYVLISYCPLLIT